MSDPTAAAMVEIREAGQPEWADLVELFGRSGASNGCWCQYWLLGAEYHHRDRELNRRDLAEQVRQGRAGLLAYADGAAVGWARLSRRSELDYLTSRFARYDFGPDDPLTLSCFFVAGPARGTGVMAALIEDAARRARERGEVIEGYPIDAALPGATRNRFPGVLAPFLAAGFNERGRLAADRVVVRAEPG